MMRDNDIAHVEKPLRWWVAVLTFVAVAALLQPAAAADRPPFEDPSQLRPVAQMVEDAKALGDEFPVVDLFEFRDSAKSLGAATREVLNDGTILTVKAESLKGLMSKEPETLTLPLDGLTTTPVEIELVRVNIFAEGFKVVTSSSNGEAVDYQPGLHYRGIVKGDPGSIAAFSFFDDEIAGIYSTSSDGDVVVGKLRTENKHNHHILYAEADLKSRLSTSAMVEGEQAILFRTSELASGFQTSVNPFKATLPAPEVEKVARRFVKVYMETDFNVFQENNDSVEEVVQFVHAIFNQTATLIGELNVPIVISEYFVWDYEDPYDAVVWEDGSHWEGYLRQFQRYRTEFSGDLAHVVAISLDPTGNQIPGKQLSGGYAEVGGLCHPQKKMKMGGSALEMQWEALPAFSISVHLLTHELGHQLGSWDTNSCVWNGNNSPIDGCSNPRKIENYPTDDDRCPRDFPFPEGENSGTIMSYCHWEGRPGIDLRNGFGPQPGAVIRNAFNNASCLGVDRDDVKMIVSFKPGPGVERETREITSSYLEPISFYYDESYYDVEPDYVNTSSFGHRPGTQCLNNQNKPENPTYLKISFDTPEIEACEFKGFADPEFIPCNQVHVGIVNNGDEVVIGTDAYKGVPVYGDCFLADPPVLFFPTEFTATFTVKLKLRSSGLSRQQSNWIYRSFTYTKHH